MALTLNFFNRITTKDRVFFMRQLSIMISSGIALSNALTLLAQQTSSAPLKQAIRVMSSDIDNGHPFSVAAARYPEIFDPISLSMLKTGEASGQMHVVVAEMSEHVDASMQFSNKIRNALLYPMFIVIVMIIVGIIMTTVIIPKLTAIFVDTNLSLPWTTRLLMGISNFMINYWYIIVAGLVFGAVSLRSYFVTPAGREALYELETKIPVVKNLIINSYLVRFTSVLGMLIKAGVPFNDALRIVSETMPAAVWSRTMSEVRQEVERGIPLSAALSRHEIIPGVLVQMISVGEQTGKIDSVLENMTNYYTEQTNTAIKGVTTLIEPVVLMIVAFGVGFVVLAVIVPIFSLTDQF